MNIKRKELKCILGKVTVEEFHDGLRMHIAVIAEHSAPGVAECSPGDEFEAAYLQAGIPLKGARREVRFSVSDLVVMELVSRGELSSQTDIISALQVLARAAWAHKDDPEPVLGFSTYVWSPHNFSPRSGNAGYGFDFSSGPSESVDY
jgi:hypothetical protein